MDNTYYILAKEQINIDRLHICTWEFPHDSSYVELGMEFSYESIKDDSLIFYLAAPFIKNDTTVSCLLRNLSDRANGLFIFNDVVNGIENVGEDSRDGSILNFEKRDCLTVLPSNIEVSNGLITFEIKKPMKYKGNLYFRVLVKGEDCSIAIKKSGIAQTTYIYDFKINETRNIPQDIYDIKKRKNLRICKIKSLFCLHAVPDSFVFSFLDSTKLKNIRKLEALAFQNYLPEIKNISKDCYNIMFLKDSGKESYSLFSMCTEESIGAKQIAFAIGANILCSLLFAFSSLRFDANIKWYFQIPLGYWMASVILLFLLLYLFTPLKRKLKI